MGWLLVWLVMRMGFFMCCRVLLMCNIRGCRLEDILVFLGLKSLLFLMVMMDLLVRLFIWISLVLMLVFSRLVRCGVVGGGVGVVMVVVLML